MIIQKIKKCSHKGPEGSSIYDIAYSEQSLPEAKIMLRALKLPVIGLRQIIVGALLIKYIDALDDDIVYLKLVPALRTRLKMSPEIIKLLVRKLI